MSNGRDDIRVAIGFLRHPKTRKLRRELGADAVLCLIQLWLYAGENRPGGVLESPEDVEDAAEWNGVRGLFLATLQKLHWLESDGVTLHDWLIEQPWAASRGDRVARAKHAADERWHAGRMRRACAENADRECPPSPSPPLPVSSPTPSPTPTPTKETDIPPSGGPGGAAVKKPRSISPAEALARELSDVIGSSLNPCRKSVAALRRSGLDDCAIANALREHAVAGMAPWDFTAKVTGYSNAAASKGMTSADILRWGKENTP